MAILQSCCCWRSLRSGSYASALYTLCYFAVMALLMGRVLHEEREYLRGNASAPQTSSVLEPDTISYASLALSAVWLCCAVSGVLTSLLLIYGIYKDNRLMLVPWILNMAATIPLDAAHIATLLAHGVNVEPIKAMVFTLDFFLISLNLYALLCVVSQYQEYRAGRGTAADQRNSPKAAAAVVAAVRYAPHPTATSLLSTRLPTGPGASGVKGSASPPSPPANAAIASSGVAPAPPPAPSTGAAAVPGHRKHVQFPSPGSPLAPTSVASASIDDEVLSTTESGGGSASMMVLWASGSGNGSVENGKRTPDTAPLIPRHAARRHGGSDDGAGSILRAPK